MGDKNPAMEAWLKKKLESDLKGFKGKTPREQYRTPFPKGRGSGVSMEEDYGLESKYKANKEIDSVIGPLRKGKEFNSEKESKIEEALESTLKTSPDVTEDKRKKYLEALRLRMRTA